MVKWALTTFMRDSMGAQLINICHLLRKKELQGLITINSAQLDKSELRSVQTIIVYRQGSTLE